MRGLAEWFWQGFVRGLEARGIRLAERDQVAISRSDAQFLATIMEREGWCGPIAQRFRAAANEETK